MMEVKKMAKNKFWKNPVAALGAAGKKAIPKIKHKIKIM
jgi:hypothetical protein